MITTSNVARALQYQDIKPSRLLIIHLDLEPTKLLMEVKGLAVLRLVKERGLTLTDNKLQVLDNIILLKRVVTNSLTHVRHVQKI